MILNKMVRRILGISRLTRWRELSDGSLDEPYDGIDRTIYRIHNDERVFGSVDITLNSRLREENRYLNPRCEYNVLRSLNISPVDVSEIFFYNGINQEAFENERALINARCPNAVRESALDEERNSAYIRFYADVHSNEDRSTQEVYEVRIYESLNPLEFERVTRTLRRRLGSLSE